MSISSELKSAILRSITGKYLVYILQLFSLAVLARLFTPEQFGILAIIQVFFMFFQMLTVSGIAPAIVYERNLTNAARDGIFSFSFILAIVLCLIFAVLIPFLHSWLDLSVSVDVFYFLLLNILFSTISMMPIASLQKDASFLKIARADIYAELLSLIVCISLYFYGVGIYALIVKLSFVSLFRFFFYYLYSAKSTLGMPKPGKDVFQVRVISGFAKFQMGFNLLNFFSRNLDNILIAKYFGPVMLGYYDKTYQVMKYPLQLFTFAVTPALQPVLTKHKDRPDVIFHEYYKVAFQLGILGVFSSFVLFWSAEDVIYLLFGDQWYQSVELLRIFSLTIPLQMILSSTGGVYQAFGATKEMFQCGVFSSVVNVGAIILGIYSESVLILCMLLSLAFLINFFQCFYVLHRSVFLSLKDVNRRFFIMVVLILLPAFNLIEFNPGYVESLSIADSILSIFKYSILSGLGCLLLYLVIFRSKIKLF